MANFKMKAARVQRALIESKNVISVAEESEREKEEKKEKKTQLSLCCVYSCRGKMKKLPVKRKKTMDE